MTEKGLPGKVRLLDEALTWWGMGISPIPVRYMSKAPLVPWKPWTDKIPPRPLVELWFRRHYPCNLGLVLREGLCVVDFDELEEYKRWSDQMPHLARSLTVRTSRGMHVYLWAAIAEGNVRHFAGGEVKLGGIVIAPPSLHASGRAYVRLERPILGVSGVDDLGLTLAAPPAPPSYRARECAGGEGLVERIKADIDIGVWLSQYTALVPHRDGSYLAVCPFHNDHAPSLQVWPGEGRCYCHSPRCAAHRRCDVITCAALKFDLDLSEAVYWLASEL